MLKRLKRALAFFWEEDRGLSVLLAVTLVTAFLGAPWAPTGGVRHAGPLDILFVLLLASGVLAVSRARWHVAVLGGMAVLAIGLHWGAVWARAWNAVALSHIAAALVLSVLTAVVLMRVFREGPITRHRIEGAVVAYLLLGLVWASLYAALEGFSQGAFVKAAGSAFDRRDAFYFSFVTLTTVGYGDIVPIHPFARSLANVEALTGQLYPAILIGRLVSLQLASRAGGDQA